MKTKMTPLKAIRAKCLDCTCYQPKEVRNCTTVDCSLFTFRFGSNPSRKGVGPGLFPVASKILSESVKTTKEEVLNEQSGNL